MRIVFKKGYQILCYISIAILILSFSGKLILLANKLASLAVIFLAIIISEKPLYKLLSKYNLYPFITKLLRYNNQQQRYQGLITVNLLLAHSVSKIISTGIANPITIDNISSVSGALVIFAVLLITSSKRVQRKFKKWKKVQGISWSISPSLMVHQWYLQQELGISFGLFTLMIVIIIIEKYIFRTSKYKQHRNFLLFGVFIALVQVYLMNNYLI